MNSETDVVTGAFSYTGQYITRRLLAAGRKVRTLTGHPDPLHPLGALVPSYPMDFRNPDRLAEGMSGCDTLYNTYWVRFPYGCMTYDSAVENLDILVRAAARAGVRKIVHISIINPSESSPFAYFRGKARAEKIIRESGLAYTILRPTLVFGPEDILVNNIAWMVRTFPVFLIPGDGNYVLQPIHVEDLSLLALEAGRARECAIVDAAGPEIITFRSLVRQIAVSTGRNASLVSVPTRIAYLAVKLLGCLVDDVVLTYEEFLALENNVLYSLRWPRGTTGIGEWLATCRDSVGRNYRSELKRHFRDGRLN